MAELSTLARPYARAAFEFAANADDLATWSKQLATAAVVANADNMVKVLTSPSLTSAQQATHFLEVCGDELTANAQNFIKVLADNKRLPLLPTISALFEEFKANREKSVEVEVATAFELDAAIQEKLATALSGKLERDVNVQTVIDKNLLGGVVVRAADVVIDGSVRGRLNKLAEAMNS
ncbi:F0F1 ATP synthase subunit delta [Oceanicoccus sagamiensis]|uniref:ATP synthase subunit delta n=1 Tax=Oceanicoccus sagamiensis TaxID=716816 RepID=A0A1X9NDM1_9GAMM|nr:F0F1 ATP synthase subunit delta [Oceanicoccus sagamiensis]ARN73985.1 F0F1 ATP synthase subunit delta [Oceanicoccus sagamiensis]